MSLQMTNTLIQGCDFLVQNLFFLSRPKWEKLGLTCLCQFSRPKLGNVVQTRDKNYGEIYFKQKKVAKDMIYQTKIEQGWLGHRFTIKL